MTIEEEGPPPHPRLQGVLEYLTILAVAIAGMAHAPPWIAVPLAAVVLLWVSDRGQHRWLVDRVRHLARGYIPMVSIGAALLLNLVATAAAYVFGVVAWWVWMG
jgi:hypothetical protein